MKDSDKKLYRAKIVDDYVKGRINRRSFLRSAGMLGLGAGVLGSGLVRPFRATPALAQGLEPDPAMLDWVREVSKPFAGTTLKLATESTPPSNRRDRGPAARAGAAEADARRGLAAWQL
jgi:multiple sugar transport system substrate-binding protein